MRGAGPSTSSAVTEPGKCTCAPPIRELDKEQCYRLLGLPREASQGDLETAYGQEKRRLYALRAQQGGRLSAEQRQTLVQLHFAHRLLADPLSRRVYDRLGVYGVVLARRGRLARRALDLLSPHQCRVVAHLLGVLTCFWCGCCFCCGFCCEFCCGHCFARCAPEEGVMCELHEHEAETFRGAPSAANSWDSAPGWGAGPARPMASSASPAPGSDDSSTDCSCSADSPTESFIRP